VELFRGWGSIRHLTAFGNAPLANYHAVLAAVPPFYWGRYAADYSGVGNAVPRPSSTAFHRDEQAWYLAFAASLGAVAEVATAPFCTLPVPPDPAFGTSPTTLVLAPGCKGGEMAAKRWPHFPALAAAFPDVAVVGTADDIKDCGPFPPHARLLVDQLSLRQTAGALASAGAVVANDSGLGHVAAALGVPTVLLFGPTSAEVLGRFPPNVTVMRPERPCAPCWFRERFQACAGRIDCLANLALPEVCGAVRGLLG
jgi:ADP-heptose:LPS heptosyltransferase